MHMRGKTASHYAVILHLSATKDKHFYIASVLIIRKHYDSKKPFPIMPQAAVRSDRYLNCGYASCVSWPKNGKFRVKIRHRPQLEEILRMQAVDPGLYSFIRQFSRADIAIQFLVGEAQVLFVRLPR